MTSSPFQEDLLSTWLDNNELLSELILQRIRTKLYRSSVGSNSLHENYQNTVVADCFWLSYHFVRILSENAQDNNRATNALHDIYPIAISQFRKQFNLETLSEEYFLSRNPKTLSNDNFNSMGGMSFAAISDIGPEPGGLLWHFTQRICFIVTGRRIDPLAFTIMADLAPFFGTFRAMILNVFLMPLDYRR